MAIAHFLSLYRNGNSILKQIKKLGATHNISDLEQETDLNSAVIIALSQSLGFDL